MDDVEMTDVAMGLATARPAFAPRSIFDSDAPAAAAGIVASAAAHHHHPAPHHPHLVPHGGGLGASGAAHPGAALHSHSHSQYHPALPLSNLSDHSLMSDFSSIHSRGGFTAEDIFEEMDRSRRRQLQAMWP